MSIHRDNLNMLKDIHHDIHHLKYDNCTKEDLIKQLEDIKDTCAWLIKDWKEYLGYDD
jgi:predicted RNA-binding protein with EMAP domain